MPQMKYRGDRSAGYVHENGTGLVGKVVGPTPRGQYFVITEAAYDEASDTTYATALELRRPEAIADDLMGGDES